MVAREVVEIEGSLRHLTSSLIGGDRKTRIKFTVIGNGVKAVLGSITSKKASKYPTSIVQPVARSLTEVDSVDTVVLTHREDGYTKRVEE